jgi:hypothetical protein
VRPPAPPARRRDLDARQFSRRGVSRRTPSGSGRGRHGLKAS